jgi:hypothetical protein
MPDQIALVPEKKKKTKAALSKKESARYMSLQEVADHYRISEATVRLGHKPFDQLYTVKVGKRRLVLRSSVDALDRRLERAAVKLADEGSDTRAIA